MELIMNTIFETEWGVIIVGALILAFFIFEFFNNKPKT